MTADPIYWFMALALGFIGVGIAAYTRKQSEFHFRQLLIAVVGGVLGVSIIGPVEQMLWQFAANIAETHQAIFPSWPFPVSMQPLFLVGEGLAGPMIVYVVIDLKQRFSQQENH